MKQSTLFLSMLFAANIVVSQAVPIPIILETIEDDRVATIIWNSKTNTYDHRYDPDKQNGVYSYKIEWGPVNQGFIHSAITPYRAHMCQPLNPGIMYQARVFALDVFGRQSQASTVITFQHDDTKVSDMRARLNGFFDDFNTPMGSFSERDWNQAYNGCMYIGKVSQHINTQFHAHNVIASNHCDRSAASSRVRHPFDFTDRTGVIEFDLDGSQRTRQFWYLDLTPFSRKRDLSAHTSIGTFDPDPSDPPYMLRVAEIGGKVDVQLADNEGRLHDMPNVYQNGACGEFLDYCNDENLETLINVRRHWRIELSKTTIKIFINGIRVVDGSLISQYSPNGLEFEIAQVNWLLFSYNTSKDNFALSMIHWDNFGFDAPSNYQQETVVHNYTDGKLGTDTDRTGNEFSVGMVSSLSEPATASIPIPDNILDENGNMPLKAELMFTIQGSDYDWQSAETITINDHPYNHPEPQSENSNLEPYEFIGSIQPYSVVMDIDPADLIQGTNEIKFYLNYPRLLNIHIELEYPISTAPDYTPPYEIYSDYVGDLMNFWQTANQVGPGIVFNEINGTQFWTLESEYQPTSDIERWYLLEDPVVETLHLEILANSEVQLGATGKAAGIRYYEIWIDKLVVQTIHVDEDSPIAGFKHSVDIDVSGFENGTHELFVQAYDANNVPSLFDGFAAHASSGAYLPTIIDIQNETTSVDLFADETGITLYPNPTNDQFMLRGELQDYHIRILDINGTVHQDLSTNVNELLISMNTIPNGLYFLQVIHKQNAIISLQKIIKQE